MQKWKMKIFGDGKKYRSLSTECSRSMEREKEGEAGSIKIKCRRVYSLRQYH
jgi:hypothetical protein